MESLWRSFRASSKSSHSNPRLDIPKRLTSSLQDLLIVLGNSLLANLSIDNRLHFTTGAYLGRGATYVVERREATGRKTVAVKHIRQDEDDGSHSPSGSEILRHRLQSVLLEVQVLLHPPVRQERNIARLLAHGWDEEIVPFIVMEYADLGTASSFLQSTKRPQSDMAQLVVDVASGLAALHGCGIIHGDMKLENVLMFLEADGTFVAKLSDFGFCGVEFLGDYSYVGTRLLNAPEVRDNSLFDTMERVLMFTKCDVYSFGILVWETFNQGLRFYSCNSIRISVEGREQAEDFLSGLERADSDLTSYADKFVEDLVCPSYYKQVLREIVNVTLRRDPQTRPRMSAVLGVAKRMMSPRDQVREDLDMPEDIERMSISSSDELSTVIRSRSLGTPMFSVFDLGLATLPWSCRIQLVEGFTKGARASQNQFAGQDCFHLAACYALGYGLKMDTSQSFAHLMKAAKLGYRPAKTIYTCFRANGLLKSDFDSLYEPLDAQHSDLEIEAAQIPPERLPSWWIKKLNMQQQNFDRIQGYYLNEHWFTMTDPQCLTELLLSADLEEVEKAYVEVVQSNEIRQVPAIHFLISYHSDAAQTLLMRGFDGFVDADSQISILNNSCALGLEELSKCIIQLFPDSAVIASKNGVTPLHWLFMFEAGCMAAIGELLIECGAKLTATAIIDLPELNLVLSGPPLHWAIMARSEPAVRTLLGLGARMADLSPSPQNYKMYPWYALDLATCLFMPEIVRALIAGGASVDGEYSEEGLTALHLLGDAFDPFRLWFYHGPNLQEAAEETVGVLLMAGADINISTHVPPLKWITSQTTCLTWAIKALLKYRPRLQYGDEDDSTPIILQAAMSIHHDQVNAEKMEIILDFAASNLPQSEFIVQCLEGLRECVKFGMTGAIREILRHLLPLRENVIDEAELLHSAVVGDNVETAELLLSFGASIDLDRGGTAAAGAAVNCSRRCLFMLLTNGSTVLSTPTAKEDSASTLLHELALGYAPAQEVFKTLSMLHEHFRDRFRPVINNFDNHGCTALHHAIIHGGLRNVALLLEGFGADANVSVQGTSISPTTLAMLVMKHPGSYVRMYGDANIRKHEEDMAAIIDYLTGTWRLAGPDPDITKNPITSLWEERSFFVERENEFDWTYIEMREPEKGSEVE